MKHKGLSRQGSLFILAALVIAAAAAVVVPRLWSQAVQACTQYTRVFVENFDTLAFKDVANCSVAGWSDDTQWNARGPITLRRIGANFAVTTPGSMGARIYAPAAGDFTGDGYPDLIGLDITGQQTGGTPLSRLVLVRNQYELDNDHPFQVDETEVYETFDTLTGPCAITAGDFSGDGLIDFFFIRDSTDDFVHDNFLAAMYINTGTADNPQFSPHNMSPNLDFTALFRSVPIYVNWLADHVTSADIDGDGDLDLLVISQDNVILVRNPGSGNFALANFEITTLVDDTGFTVGCGGSCISAADLDNDGDIDFVAGTVNDLPYLVIYKNDGLGHFTREELAIPNPECTGSVGIQARDFNNDGWADIFVVTDRWNAGNLAHMWMMQNVMSEDQFDTTVDPPVKIEWEFKCLNNCDPIIPPLYDVDASTALDYDNDGDLDVIISDANHTDDYYLVENDLAEFYALYGQAQSSNVGGGFLDPRLHAVTQVRIRSILQGVRGGSSAGLGVAVYFSNNGGKDWEFYRRFEGAEIAPAGPFDWHTFNQFGADLRWRAVLTAEDDLIPDFSHSSYETPSVGEIDLEYIYVDRREYSRASAAATVVDQLGTPKKLVIGSSFIYPGWEGQLRAYDVSGVSFAAGTSSALQTITTSDLDAAAGRTLTEGAEIFWDAGQMLNDRTPDSRRIFTAVRAARNPSNPLARMDFTRANVATLAPFLGDDNGDNAGLIDFVRGENRYWKMGDVNHSTPAIVGPPTEDPDYMGAGYDDFRTAYSGRAKVIY
ncbi:MAG: FG-GAP-like repeat-containing protein, partial [Candidatus Aminicenantes bacterium]|nr:FG-GAP-like repeat-containing protein [Candidatus Aminicenantes bacterium]